MKQHVHSRTSLKQGCTRYLKKRTSNYWICVNKIESHVSEHHVILWWNFTACISCFFGVIFTLPAKPGRVLYSSRFFFLSGNTSFSHTFLHSILNKLGLSDQCLDHYSLQNNSGVKGHDRVTGSKRSFSPKWFNWNRLHSFDTWLMHMY